MDGGLPQTSPPRLEVVFFFERERHLLVRPFFTLLLLLQAQPKLFATKLMPAQVERCVGRPPGGLWKAGRDSRPESVQKA